MFYLFNKCELSAYYVPVCVGHWRHQAEGTKGAQWLVRESCPDKGRESACWEGLDVRKAGPSWKCQGREGDEVGQGRLAGLAYEWPGETGSGFGTRCLLVGSLMPSCGRDSENDCDRLVTLLDLISLWSILLTYKGNVFYVQIWPGRESWVQPHKALPPGQSSEQPGAHSPSTLTNPCFLAKCLCLHIIDICCTRRNSMLDVI